MKRSKHNLSYTHLLSGNMGRLIPINTLEILPGDSVQMSTSALIRVSPLVSPVMHPVIARIHHWFVPYRLIWDEWEAFITGGPDGNSVPEFPTRVPGGANGYAVGSLGDYLGLPTGVAGLRSSVLPFRACALIYNEWYRDQDLQNPIALSTGSGNDNVTSVTIQRCAWEKDYFTSARPWEQKGPQVSIPLVGKAPVTGLGIIGNAPSVLPDNSTVREYDGPVNWPSGVLMGTTAGNGPAMETNDSTPGARRPRVFADLSQVSGITVNQLRQSLAIQRFEEARARYGSRYTEYLRALGVRSSDARLQRPEYLGGGKQTVQFSEVLQTAPDPTSGEPVGSLKGHGITAMRSNRFRKFFEEHGIVVSFLSLRPKTVYTDGMYRMWNRRTKYDFWQKELQHIGQQQVLNKEIYAAHSQPDGVFGYQDRYDEYRRKESMVSGEFRTSILDFWHMSREFASEPALNASFVACTPTDRIFAVPSKDTLYVHCRHSIQARRLIAASGTSFTF